MAIIKGITVTLWEHARSEEDDFGAEQYTDTPVEVNNVLVAPATSQEILDANDLYSKKAIYTLAIPKGDTHDWYNKKVSFFGKVFRTFGVPLEGIECDIPLDWNKKVTVEVNE